jgi:hypothetical protein
VTPCRPAVILWYRVYCIVAAVGTALGCALLAGMLVFANAALQLVSDSVPDPAAPTGRGASPLPPLRFEVTPLSAAPIVLGSLVVVAFVAAFFLRRTPSSWVYHAVLIGLGLLSPLLPLCVPLLIVWFQPQTQAYFGRSTATA